MKRFTETTKWDDPWFIDLPDYQKTLWMYICDKCDNSGVIDISLRVVNFLLNTEQDISTGIEYFCKSERMIKLDNGKYFLPKFISFQFGELKESSNLHKNVIQKLKEHNLYDNYIKGSYTLHEGLIKGTGKGKGLSKGNLIDKKQRAQSIERILKLYPKVILHNKALVSIGNAIQREVDKGSSEENAIKVIEQAAIEYAKEFKENNQFAIECTKWMDGGGYHSIVYNSTPKKNETKRSTYEEDKAKFDAENDNYVSAYAPEVTK